VEELDELEQDHDQVAQDEEEEAQVVTEVLYDVQ
jgi:hypothetical protein